VNFARRHWIWLLPAVAYCALFIGFASRRWACWSDACSAQLAANIESAVLFLWVDDWEAIVAAGLALLAAIVGLQWSSNKERSRLQQLLMAARAGLSHALSDLSEYLQNAARYASDVHRLATVGVVPTAKLATDPPELPASAIAALREVILASSVREARPFAALLIDLQIQRANLRSLSDKVATSPNSILQHEIEVLLARTVIADARMYEMFRYARFEIEKVPDEIARSTVFNSARVLNLDDLEFQDLFQLLDNKFTAAE
jgi:hypothetical protein